MASEEGVVIRADASGTWVKTVRSDACESCASKGTCHTLGGGREMEVFAVNPIGARAGDRVVLKMDTLSFLKGTFLVYMFPILLLVGGAALGEWISISSNQPSPLPSVLFGFGGLALGLILMKRIANRLAERDDYRPRIARVIGREPR
ncbi:MAG: SoxR reducing system RseC family protein [Desulfobacterales bacterium]|nr:SoxR reducing system RseC family protein [Desulfobacterales bacterium]